MAGRQLSQMDQLYLLAFRLQLRPKRIFPLKGLDGPPRRAGEDQVMRPLGDRVQRPRSGGAKAAQLHGNAEEVLVGFFLEWNVEGQIVGVPGITQKASVD